MRPNVVSWMSRSSHMRWSLRKILIPVIAIGLTLVGPVWGQKIGDRLRLKPIESKGPLIGNLAYKDSVSWKIKMDTRSKPIVIRFDQVEKIEVSLGEKRGGAVGFLTWFGGSIAGGAIAGIVSEALDKLKGEEEAWGGLMAEPSPVATGIAMGIVLGIPMGIYGATRKTERWQRYHQPVQVKVSVVGDRPTVRLSRSF